MSEQQLKSQIAEIACHYSVPEFIEGQIDCRKGKAHKGGKGESYEAGYGCEYQLEQIRGADRGRGD